MIEILLLCASVIGGHFIYTVICDVVARAREGRRTDPVRGFGNEMGTGGHVPARPSTPLPIDSVPPTPKPIPEQGGFPLALGVDDAELIREIEAARVADGLGRVIGERFIVVEAALAAEAAVCDVSFVEPPANGD